MKTTLTFLTLILLSLSATANAKVQWNNKLMGDMHANTIKGFLYDVSHSPMTNGRMILWRPTFAKALVWLNRAHADKKLYILENCKKKKETKLEASIILDAIGAIADVVRRKVPHFKTDEEINAALVRWTTLGKKVVVSYNKKDVITNGKRETKIKWVFKLNVKKTKNLIEKW